MPNRRRSGPREREISAVLTRRSRFRARIGAASLALLGVLAALATACGESSTRGGGAGGAAAGAASIGVAGGLGGSPAAAGGGLSFGGAAGGAAGAGASSGGACKHDGEMCADSRDCCANAVCNNTAGALALNGCHTACMQNSDCTTGCCVPFTGANHGICAEAIWCGCGMTGAACGSQLPECCGDQICLANDPGRPVYACQKQCMTSADCPTKCCVAIPNLGKSACLDPMYCPSM